MNSDEVETRIRATLRAVAETSDRAADRSLVAIAELDEPSRGTHRRARALVLSAVAVVVVCVAASVAVVATLGNRVAIDTRAALNVPRSEWRTTSAPLLAPTWLPSHLHLYQMESGPATTLPGGSNLTMQLFGTADRYGKITEGLALRTLRATGISVEGTSVRVRGHDARIEREAGGVSSLSWIENNDIEMSATFHGLTLQRVVEVIDALRPRSDHPLDGFDPTSAPADLRLLGESLAGPKDNRTADLRYAPALTADDLGLTQFIVRATTAGDPATYLEDLVRGQRATDGSVEVDSFSGPEPGGSGPTLPIARVLWPDGRSIEVTGGFGVNDFVTLRRVARSAHLVDAAHVERLRTTIDERLGKLPIWATAPLDGFALELRGDARPLAACLRIGNQKPICAAMQGPTGPAVGEVAIGAQWIVFAAQQDAPTFDITGTTAHPHQIEVRGWHLALVSLGTHATAVDISGTSSVTRPST